MAAQTPMIERIAAMQDYRLYKELHWEGTFEEYLQIVRERPQVTRNAYQRVYDMIISYGTEEYIDNKKKLVRYNFFKDELGGGRTHDLRPRYPADARSSTCCARRPRGTGRRSASSCFHGPVGCRRARSRAS